MQKSEPRKGCPGSTPGLGVSYLIKSKGKNTHCFNFEAPLANPHFRTEAVSKSVDDNLISENRHNRVTEK